MYNEQKTLNLSSNFCLKLFRISQGTNKIVLHVTKQYLQAVYHLLSLIHRLHQNVTVN